MLQLSRKRSRLSRYRFCIGYIGHIGRLSAVLTTYDHISHLSVVSAVLNTPLHNELSRISKLKPLHTSRYIMYQPIFCSIIPLPAWVEASLEALG